MLEVPNLLGWLGAVAGGLYFTYRVAAGALLAAGQFKIAVERGAFPGNDQQDVLAVISNIERDENWAIRLRGGDVRVTKCLFEGRELSDEELPKVHMELWPLILDKSGQWRRRNDSDNQPFMSGHYNLGPKEKAAFCAFLIVPKGSVCIVEATLSYDQWSWLPRFSGMSFMASAASFPTSPKVSESGSKG